MPDKLSLILECLGTVDSSEGRQRVWNYLKSQPFPHYEAAAGTSESIVRIDANEHRTLGRFMNRRFEVASDP